MIGYIIDNSNIPRNRIKTDYRGIYGLNYKYPILVYKFHKVLSDFGVLLNMLPSIQD